MVGFSLVLRPLAPVDETRYVSVAWEMWVRGDLLVPHLNGLPYSDKPPLMFWLIQLGWHAFGVEAWWPRLVPPLFALANLFLTAALARRLWPDRPAVARLAPLVLLGFLLWAVYSTVLMFDMLVTTFVLLAMMGFHRARHEGGVRPWVWTGLALGAGILAKGPVALLPALGVVLSPTWWEERERVPAAARPPRGGRWGLGVLAAVAVAAAVGLAWAIPAAMSGGPAYADAIFRGQTEGRLVQSFAHGRPWWWYLALLPALLFPYSAWAPLWQSAARLRRQSLEPALRFCVAWVVPAFLVFSLISGKQPHYLLPLLPAVALVAARLLADVRGEAAAVRFWHLLPPLSSLLILGVALLLVRRLTGALRLPAWAASISPALGVAALLFCGVLLIGFVRWRPRVLPTLINVAFVLTAYLGFAEVGRQAYDLGPMARYLKRIEEQGRPIAFVGEYHGELHFLGRLERPFDEIATGQEAYWLQTHPTGRLVREFRKRPPDAEKAEILQPYRGDFLAVLGPGYVRSGQPSG
jgi:4-amino-4-deoxy-L-arabinose transferase-like glycosyltransferase